MAYDEIDEMLDELSGDVAIGGEEIVGYDELIGKAKSAGRPDLAQKLILAKKMDQNAVALVKTRGGPRRRKVMAGASTVIGIGATENIRFEAQENFRPEEFFVQGANIDDFIINSIKIGTEEQFVNSGQCPADVFSPLCLRSNVHFKTMNLGSICVVNVTNTNAAARTFNSAFIGTAMD